MGALAVVTGSSHRQWSQPAGTTPAGRDHPAILRAPDMRRWVALKITVTQRDPAADSVYLRHANRVFLGTRHDGGVGVRKAPSGLGPSGRALWRDIHRDYGLAAHESAILTQCCR